jgi:hypothetical protein
MNTVVTAIESTTGDVILSWSAPSDNSADITSYKVEIVDHDGLVWSEELTYCDASTEEIMAAFMC